MNRYSTRACFCMMALVAVQGCTSHHKIPLAQSREPLSVKGRVRVTATDRTRMYLDSVTVTADSVVGRQLVLGSGGTKYQRVAISTTNVTALETDRVNAPKTFVIILVSMFLLGGIAVGTQGLLGGGS